MGSRRQLREPMHGTRRAIETVRELILRSRRTGEPLDQVLLEDERTAGLASELDLDELREPATYLGTAGGAPTPVSGEE